MTCRTKFLVCILLGVTSLSPAISDRAFAEPLAFDTAAEELYRQRFDRLFGAAQRGLGLETYEPLESVPGAAGHAYWSIAPSGSIPAAALAQARHYAERNNSSALLIWHDGALEAADYFKGNTAVDLIPSRSLAKPMTAVAVGRALALGAIKSLDQPVADFVTEWRGDTQRERILVRHLLDMRAGFLPQTAEMDPSHILNRAYLHPYHGEIIIREYPLVDEPGSRYEYNNAASEMVAILIERATGRRYAEFLSTEILQPIGAPGGSVWVNREGGLAHSGCCLLLPPEAWLRLGVLLLQDGHWQDRGALLPPGFVAAMRQGTAENKYYGLGVYIAGPYIARRGFANPEREAESRRVLHSEPYLADDLFLFDGNANQVIYIIPSRKLVIARTGNTPPRSATAEWDNSYLPNLIMRSLHFPAEP